MCVGHLVIYPYDFFFSNFRYFFSGCICLTQFSFLTESELVLVYQTSGILCGFPVVFFLLQDGGKFTKQKNPLQPML